jgi:hypothetical protein
MKISMREIFIKIIWLPLELAGFLLYTAILEVFNKSFTLFHTSQIKSQIW